MADLEKVLPGATGRKQWVAPLVWALLCPLTKGETKVRQRQQFTTKIWANTQVGVQTNGLSGLLLGESLCVSKWLKLRDNPRETHSDLKDHGLGQREDVLLQKEKERLQWKEERQKKKQIKGKERAEERRKL